MLPAGEKPEYTEDYEGFFHMHKLAGTTDVATAEYIIRDHDREKFESRKELFQKNAEYLNLKYGENTVKLEMKDCYYNMREKIEPVYHIVEIAEQAMEAVGVEPLIKPIRGGTDGSRLSYMGLPTPNIFTGGMNFHGKYEYISTTSMEKAVAVILKIVEIHTERH